MPAAIAMFLRFGSLWRFRRRDAHSTQPYPIPMSSPPCDTTVSRRDALADSSLAAAIAYLRYESRYAFRASASPSVPMAPRYAASLPYRRSSYASSYASFAVSIERTELSISAVATSDPSAFEAGSLIAMNAPSPLHDPPLDSM